MKIKPIELTTLAMILAVCFCLNMLESMLPIPSPVPGVKIGLANVLVMFVCFNLGARQAILIVVLKSIFVLLTRGAIAGVLSLSGGIVSVSILLLLITFNKSLGQVGMSISAAIAHNLAQLILASIILGNMFLVYILPVLLLAGILMGCITSMILVGCKPALIRIRKKVI